MWTYGFGFSRDNIYVDAGYADADVEVSQRYNFHFLNLGKKTILGYEFLHIFLFLLHFVVDVMQYCKLQSTSSD